MKIHQEKNNTHLESTFPAAPVFLLTPALTQYCTMDNGLCRFFTAKNSQLVSNWILMSCHCVNTAKKSDIQFQYYTRAFLHSGNIFNTPTQFLFVFIPFYLIFLHNPFMWWITLTDLHCIMSTSQTWNSKDDARARPLKKNLRTKGGVKDGDTVSLTTLQWLSEGKNRIRINSLSGGSSNQSWFPDSHSSEEKICSQSVMLLCLATSWIWKPSCESILILAPGVPSPDGWPVSVLCQYCTSCRLRTAVVVVQEHYQPQCSSVLLKNGPCHGLHLSHVLNVVTEDKMDCSLQYGLHCGNYIIMYLCCRVPYWVCYRHSSKHLTGGLRSYMPALWFVRRQLVRFWHTGPSVLTFLRLCHNDVPVPPWIPLKHDPKMVSQDCSQ